MRVVNWLHKKLRRPAAQQLSAPGPMFIAAATLAAIACGSVS
jgi:hypothetical protein